MEIDQKFTGIGRPPAVTLDATDLHAPEALKLLARKVRGTDPRRADELERTAKQFETWRQAYIRR